MKLSKVLQEAHAQNVCKSVFSQALLVLLKLLGPMAPHISSELWEGECGAYVNTSSRNRNRGPLYNKFS